MLTLLQGIWRPFCAMLRCGADVMAFYKGRTALHCAAKAGFVYVLEALIEYGGDVNALN